SRSPAPTTKSISVKLGARERMGHGGVRRVTVRPSASITVVTEAGGSARGGESFGPQPRPRSSAAAENTQKVENTQKRERTERRGRAFRSVTYAGAFPRRVPLVAPCGTPSSSTPPPRTTTPAGAG